MAVRQPFQRDFSALPVENFEPPYPRPPFPMELTATPACPRPARRLRRNPQRPCTVSRNRRRRRSALPARQSLATPDCATALDSGIDTRSITADTPNARTAWRDRRQGRPTHPIARTGMVRRSQPWPRAAPACDSARQARRARRYRLPRRGPFPPLRTASPSAASPIMPVAIALTGFRPAAMNHLARRHPAERGDRDHQRTRRRCPPPSSGQPNCAASSPSAAANGFNQSSSALRSADVSTKPAGVAPFAARSERFTRNAARRCRGIVGQEVDALTIASS